ncbi:hypothetical protein M8J76_005255 [Diaphorina citri]|nr:hypothetical protein M8J75_006897 [Diaphorina citri]KAI5726590.1 hypothetical protein M8J76_005255 [Diaphorina citri]
MSMKYIYHTKVIIEPPKKKTGLVQCMRCQQYGHTKNDCMRPWRCVKCASNHKTTDCPKTDRNTPATCVLCLEEHPANFKGCSVYLEILKRKTKEHKSSSASTYPRTNTNKTSLPPNQLQASAHRENTPHGERTYAQASQGPPPLNTATWTKQARSHIRKTIPSN